MAAAPASDVSYVSDPAHATLPAPRKAWGLTERDLQCAREYRDSNSFIEFETEMDTVVEWWRQLTQEETRTLDNYCDANFNKTDCIGFHRARRRVASVFWYHRALLALGPLRAPRGKSPRSRSRSPARPPASAPASISTSASASTGISASADSKTKEKAPQPTHPWKYVPDAISTALAKTLYHQLRDLVLQVVQREGRPTIKVFGKERLEPRLKAYFSKTDQQYAYSGTAQKSQGWPTVIALLAATAQPLVPAGHTFTRVLVNYYRDGRDSVGAHRDDDALKGYIVSFSMYESTEVTEQRKFWIRKNDKTRVAEIMMAHGSAIVMEPGMQKDYIHEVPKMLKVKTGRINVTLREDQ